jgi:mono/diheme cytochrome c family protein
MMGAAAGVLLLALVTPPEGVTAETPALAGRPPGTNRSDGGTAGSAREAPAIWRAAEAAAQQQRGASGPEGPAQRAAATLQQYCVTCHNERMKSAGLVIDPAALADVSAHADVWEKVVRKLRTGSMPPVGVRRPDTATYQLVASHLESALDAAAAARPQLGTAPLAHRLTRTEYGNAVRDLLGLEALPREAGIALLLPPDNVSSGFDNIADLLFVSPSNMERYLDAARKVSRLAVGDPRMPVLVNIHRLNPEHPQDERVDALPFGTRGGLAIRSDLPVEGRYVVKVELAGAPRERHDLEVTVDGERVALRTLGDSGGRGGRGGRGAGGAGRGAAGDLEFPLTLTAGTKVVGVAYVQRTEARDEATLRPRMRSRGTQPAIASVTLSGPYDAVPGSDSPSRRRIFSCRPSSASEEAPCARQILAALARRAYRRPVGEADVRDLLPFYETGRAERDFDYGIQRALERLLVSPQFLFRIERPATGIPGSLSRVSDIELASRLSFFLWSSIPDDELLNLAGAGRLHEPAILEAQVRRLLADPRADALVTNFAAQWLFLRDLEAKRPDEILFADFDVTLRDAMARETELFLGSVFREDRSVLDLLRADYTFLNERLAKHYGIPHVRGSHFRRVTLPAGSVRGGLLGQGSVLTITSYSTRTSPVVRGKWVLENLLSSAPPPPPPDVPSLSTEGHERETPLTLRDAMVRHRANPACAGCHATMDPIGFAMENFDAVGRWRERDGTSPIDASGAFPDGTTFNGVAGLKTELLRQPEQLVGTVAEKLLMYAIGRNVHYYDAPTVRAIVRDAAATEYAFSSLILGVVKSRPFQMRQAVSE